MFILGVCSVIGWTIQLWSLAQIWVNTMYSLISECLGLTLSLYVVSVTGQANILLWLLKESSHQKPFQLD